MWAVSQSASSPDERPLVIKRLVLFGASGDLTGRVLLPALAALRLAGRLPDDFRLVGAARERWDDAAFREHAAEALGQHAADVPASAREAIVRSLSYRQVDLTDRDSVGHAVADDGSGSASDPLAAYLALPPGLFAATVEKLAAAKLPPGSRIAIEKPFGEDLASAASLNELLFELFGEATEQTVFRVDPVLGMATAQNLLGLRLGDRLLGAVWDSTQVEQVEVLWEEELALEGRAAYYDGAGALRDVMQNHMLQVLCLLAMEPPANADERALRDSKAEVLKSLRPPPGDPASWTRRARYTAGKIGDRAVPAYAEEEGVDPERRTETFAEVLLEVDSKRWKGTRFLLRAGKAFARRRKEAVIRFRPAPQLARATAAANGARNELRIGIEGPEDLTLSLVGGAAGATPGPAPVRLTGPPPPSDLPAYGRVLLDVLEGGSTLSVRGDAAEASWRVMTPVLEAWTGGAVPLEEYPAGSSGPPRLA